MQKALTPFRGVVSSTGVVLLHTVSVALLLTASTICYLGAPQLLLAKSAHLTAGDDWRHSRRCMGLKR